MASDGVVAVQPAKEVQMGFALGVPGPAALQGLAFEGGVEGLGEWVVRAGADRARGLGGAGLAAGVGEGPAAVLGPVIAVGNGAGETAAGPFGRVQGVDDEVARMWSATAHPARRREARSVTVAG